MAEREEYIEPITGMRSFFATHQLQVERKRESIEPNQVAALTTHQLHGARGERVIEANQVYALCPHTSLQLEREESHRANQSVWRCHYHLATGLERRRRECIEPIQVVCAHHTPAQVERRESHRANQVYALTTHQLQWRGERVIEPIKCMRATHQLQVERRESIEPIK